MTSKRKRQEERRKKRRKKEKYTLPPARSLSTSVRAVSLSFSKRAITRQAASFFRERGEGGEGGGDVERVRMMVGWGEERGDRCEEKKKERKERLRENKEKNERKKERKRAEIPDTTPARALPSRRSTASSAQTSQPSASPTRFATSREGEEQRTLRRDEDGRLVDC